MSGVKKVLQRLKFSISYDGTNLNGWEGDFTNKNSRFIKSILSDAFLKFSGKSAEFFCAGRTDAGVHAVNNVCHIEIDFEISDLKRLMLGLNFFLPEDIKIKSVEKAEPDFHARFSAKRRHYKYLITNEEYLNPILSRRVLNIKKKIDFEKMNQMLTFLKNQKELSIFAPVAVQFPEKRNLEEAFIEKTKFLNIEIFEINFIAKSFFHHQVRTMVSCLVNFSTNNMTFEEFCQFFNNRDRNKIANMVPPNGLHLFNVKY